jgi:hypothetical protein
VAWVANAFVGPGNAVGRVGTAAAPDDAGAFNKWEKNLAGRTTPQGLRLPTDRSRKYTSLRKPHWEVVGVPGSENDIHQGKPCACF